MRFFRLKFHNALHVDSKGSGEPEAADEFVHSDTLSAALCIAWATVHSGSGQELFQSPPFMVSSAYPYVGETLLFPVPAWSIWRDQNIDNRKVIKTVRWLSATLFLAVLEGRQVAFADCLVLPGGIAVSPSEITNLQEFYAKPAWIISERQRVRVDRLGLESEGGLFFFALQFFAKDAGLYLLVETEMDLWPKFRAALDFLGDTGLGADRTSGLGHFKVVHEEDLDLNGIASADGWVTLSLFNPGPKDKMPTLARACAYNLTTRSGWIAGTKAGRPPIRVFTEGAFFGNRPHGRVVAMLPTEIQERFGLSLGHEAHRDFRAFAIPCATPLRL